MKSFKLDSSLVDHLPDSQSEQSYELYIKNLQNNYKTVVQALKTAQNLITVYQTDNNQLKHKNQLLQQQIIDQQEQLQYLKGLIMDEQSQNKMQNQMRQLIIRSQETEKVVNSLASQLAKSKAKAKKIIKQKQQKFENTLNHYFEFGNQGSKTCENSQILRLNQEIRALRWTLQRKDEEIGLLVRKVQLLLNNQSNKQSGNEGNTFHTFQANRIKTHS